MGYGCKFMHPGRVVALVFFIIVVLGILIGPKLWNVRDRQASSLQYMTEEDEFRDVAIPYSKRSYEKSGITYPGREKHKTLRSERQSNILLKQDRTILCFGDSLTWGTNRGQPEQDDPHPYAYRLAELLRRPLVQSNGLGHLRTITFPGNSVIEYGWPGE